MSHEEWPFTNSYILIEAQKILNERRKGSIYQVISSDNLMGLRCDGSRCGMCRTGVQFSVSAKYSVTVTLLWQESTWSYSYTQIHIYSLKHRKSKMKEGKEAFNKFTLIRSSPEDLMLYSVYTSWWREVEDLMKIQDGWVA